MFLQLKHKPKPAPIPFRIDGIADAQLTPEPDEAEVAAQALLESMSSRQKKCRYNFISRLRRRKKSATKGADYFRELAIKIRATQNAEANATLRYVVYVEKELGKNILSAAKNNERLGKLERGLYKRMDVVDREGGELKRRWQHALADVTVKMANITGND